MEEISNNISHLSNKEFCEELPKLLLLGPNALDNIKYHNTGGLLYNAPSKEELYDALVKDKGLKELGAILDNALKSNKMI